MVRRKGLEPTEKQPEGALHDATDTVDGDDEQPKIGVTLPDVSRHPEGGPVGFDLVRALDLVTALDMLVRRAR
jgi:hypothetical protein